MFIRFDNPFSPRDERYNIFRNYILSFDVTLNINQIKEIKVYQDKDSTFWRVCFSYDPPTSPQYKPITVFFFSDRNIVIHYYENLLSAINDINNKDKIVRHSSLFLDCKYGDGVYNTCIMTEIVKYFRKKENKNVY